MFLYIFLYIFNKLTKECEFDSLMLSKTFLARMESIHLTQVPITAWAAG